MSGAGDGRRAVPERPAARGRAAGVPRPERPQRATAPDPDGLRLANPYDLSTWQGAGGPGGPAGSSRAAGTGGRGPSTSGGDRRRGPGDRGDRSDAGDLVGGDGRAARVGDGGPDDPVEPEDVTDPVDPPELPRRDDPFELARRTVNRSRAAARDRGLFPISAKTQARDVRDRSRSSPGYSGARPDPRDPQGIELILRRVLSDLGWNAGMSSGRVLEEWDEIVGPTVAEHCRPVSFEDGVLVVSASSSAWAAQLRMITPQLITTIEEHIGSHVVSELSVTGPAAAQRTWKRGRRTVTWRGPRDTYG